MATPTDKPEKPEEMEKNDEVQPTTATKRLRHLELDQWLAGLQLLPIQVIPKRAIKQKEASTTGSQPRKLGTDSLAADGQHSPMNRISAPNLGSRTTRRRQVPDSLNWVNEQLVGTETR